MRLHVFSNLNLEPVAIEPKSFWFRDRPQDGVNDPATMVNSVTFKTGPIKLHN